MNPFDENLPLQVRSRSHRHYPEGQRLGNLETVIGPHEKGQGQETTIKATNIPEQVSLVKLTVLKSVLQEESHYKEEGVNSKKRVTPRRKLASRRRLAQRRKLALGVIFSSIHCLHLPQDGTWVSG